MSSDSHNYVSYIVLKFIVLHDEVRVNRLKQVVPIRTGAAMDGVYAPAKKYARES